MSELKLGTQNVKTISIDALARDAFTLIRVLFLLIIPPYLIQYADLNNGEILEYSGWPGEETV